jgi:hypothetical protein
MFGVQIFGGLAMSSAVAAVGGRKPKGEYRVGPRLAKAFELMVAGVPLPAAAEQAEITARAIYLALKRPGAGSFAWPDWHVAEFECG